MEANNVRSEERNLGKIPFLSFYGNQKGETYEEENGCGIARCRSGNIVGGLWGASETGNTGEAKTENEETAGDEPAEEAGNTENTEESTLTYGSGDYTRINPAMDEHCEINVLLFNGLTAHDADDQVVPGLAESWDYDEDTYTYTFHIRDGIKWHDGEPFTADDVKFTIEAIMDPDNGSENAPNYEDVQEITVTDDRTIAFKLAEPNVAFLEYMTMAILPKHLLDGEDMQESDFFRHPIGTGPYKLESWDAGQSIVMVKNEDYYLGSPKIDKVIFKIVEDDNTQAVQLQSGEIDMALLDPKNAQSFKDAEDYTCYDMTTSDYRGIMFNFGNDYWTENKDIIPAVCYGIDRQAIIDAVLLGQGMPLMVHCREISTMMRMWNIMIIIRKRQKRFLRMQDVPWVMMASMKETGKRSVL